MELEFFASGYGSKSGIMKSLVLRQELILVAILLIVSCCLRWWHLDREAIDHFDEGVYSSVLWYDEQTGQSYPAREFYAPPALPFCIWLSSWIPGLSDQAPLIPALVFGSLTPLVFWLTARRWFGVPAGLFALSVCGLSEFHILYSRMAMTDVPALFWIVLSVSLGVEAVSSGCVKLAAASGICCGIAWWFKYTGWLPIAILTSGSCVWWLWVGRKATSVVQVVKSLAIISATAIAVFAPWLWQLQSVGGYSAISQHHSGFMSGWKGWSQHLGEQFACQFWLDGFFGAMSLGLGMLTAGLVRWRASLGSTWNMDKPGVEGKGNATADVLLLLRFVGAAVGLWIVTLRIWTPLMLCCLAAGGGSGVVLWPVLQRLWQRARLGDTSPTSENGRSMTEADLQIAPAVDPAFGFCITACWFAGMLLTTPLYHPYSRLFFPFLASVWLASAAGVGWWLESNVSVARRDPADLPKRSWANTLVNAMLAAAVFSSFLQVNQDEELEVISIRDLVHSSLYAPRTSIRDAATSIANVVASNAEGQWVPNLPTVTGDTIFPANVKPSEFPDVAPMTLEQRSRIKAVVYVYGEPSLLFHLNRNGILARPVASLDVPPHDGVPTYLIFGPNAKHNAGFWDALSAQETRMSWLVDVPWRPGEISLLDLFSTRWLRLHEDATTQDFELYRIRSSGN